MPRPRAQAQPGVGSFSSKKADSLYDLAIDSWQPDSEPEPHNMLSTIAQIKTEDREEYEEAADYLYKNIDKLYPENGPVNAMQKKSFKKNIYGSKVSEDFQKRRDVIDMARGMARLERETEQKIQGLMNQPLQTMPMPPEQTRPQTEYERINSGQINI